MVDYTAFRFRIATKPLPVKGTHNKARDGILLRSKENPSIWSEASPLPGFSPDTIDDVIDSLHSRSADVPSLRFATDCLTNEFPSAGEVPLCALLAESDRDHFKRQANWLGNSAYSAVKLKVGRQAVDDDILRVQLLRKSLRADQSIRLDANRSWNLDDAIRFVQAASDCNIDFIEEPLRDPTLLERFHQETECQYALDETLADRRTNLQDFPNASVLVIKPTVLGPFERIEELTSLGKRIVFSSVFESGVGIYHIGRMAAAFTTSLPVGLDTYRWLHEDVLSQRWHFDEGYYRFAGPPEVDATRLTPIT